MYHDNQYRFRFNLRLFWEKMKDSCSEVLQARTKGMTVCWRCLCWVAFITKNLQNFRDYLRPFFLCLLGGKWGWRNWHQHGYNLCQWTGREWRWPVNSGNKEQPVKTVNLHINNRHHQRQPTRRCPTTD